MQLPLLSATYSKRHNSGKDNDYQHFIQTNKYSGHNDFFSCIAQGYPHNPF